MTGASVVAEHLKPRPAMSASYTVVSAPPLLIWLLDNDLAKAAEDGSRVWAPDIHTYGRPRRSFWPLLQLGPALAFAAFWGMKQKMENLSVTLPFKEINSLTTTTSGAH